HEDKGAPAGGVFSIFKSKEDETMKSIWVGIQLAFSALGGFLGWYLGGVDGFLYALIAFVLVDYVTGVMCAIADKKLSSAVGFKGICRKRSEERRVGKECRYRRAEEREKESEENSG